MSFLEVKNLSLKYFYGALAFSDVTFSAEKGEVVTLLGKSESGKTSLLKTIAGVRRATCGEIFCDGKPLSQDKRKKSVTMIFENGMFFENKSLYYNLTYPLKIRKFNKQTIKAKVDAVTEKFGLTEWTSSAVKKLSPSKRIKLALARADLRETELFLCDDILKICPEERKETFGFLWSFLKEKSKNAVVIYATDDRSEACLNPGQTILLNYGTVMQTGKASDIAVNPNSVYATEVFYDEPNFLLSKIYEKEGEIFLSYNDERIPLEKEKLLSRIYIGKEVKAFRTVDGKIKLFDIGSEKTIYFN